MIEQLLEKIKSWSQETADRFHNFTDRDAIEGRYVWESTNNGFFLYRDIGSYYFSNDGKVYLLTKWSNENDWIMHTNFYKLIKDTSCRIDIPVTHQIVKVDTDIFYYKEFVRPNYQYGRDYHIDIFNGIVDQKYFEKFIEDAYEIIYYLNQANIKQSIMLPEVGISVFKRMYDNIGHFWIDFKRWKLTPEEFIRVSINNLNTTIFYLEYNNLGTFERQKIIKMAEKKWISV
jgi:hypothetical protein